MGEIIRADRVDFLWRFKDADQELEPFSATLVFKADDFKVEDDDLGVIVDVPAIFASIVECPAFVPPLALKSAAFGLERNCAVSASCASCPVLAARLGNVEVEFSIPIVDGEVAAVA